jgi:hypothetical protein
LAVREKRGPGRPKKPRDAVDIAFSLSAEQADFLFDMGRRLGWGESVHSMAQRLVSSEIAMLQKASVAAHPLPLPEPGED